MTRQISYDRNSLKCGILHIGVGNFHRAHEAWFTDRLIASDPTQCDWAICGVMLLDSDRPLYDALKGQDNLYTLTECGRDGNDSAGYIGSLRELIWAPADKDRALDRMADRDIRIISMTITEGGYNIRKDNGEFDLDNPAVKADLVNPGNPSTVFGYVAEGLRRRRDNGAGKVTVLTCDNLQHNGDTARKAFTTFIKAQDPKLSEWVEENVTFPNSMVDRITPATTPQIAARLNERNATDDAAPVFCEDFIQWVIEDNFAAGRPQWENAGVEFTDDVTAYENMKLSLLNASHTMLSYPAFLSGYRKVDEAIHDPCVRRLVEQYMDIDTTPYVPAPGSIDLTLYKKTLVERFRNASVSDQVARLCSDGLSKFPVYVMPNLAKMIADGKDQTRTAYLLAAYRRYLLTPVDDNGESYDITEPWLTEADRRRIESADPLDFLDLPAFGAVRLRDARKFADCYLEMVDLISEKGAMATLRENVIGE